MPAADAHADALYADFTLPGAQVRLRGAAGSPGPWQARGES
ncbi:hypothetical protein [Streptomyces sp. NPDC015242]